MNTSSHSVARGENQTDTAKLVSLLALATGAVAMPQTGQADIIYTDLTGGPGQVGWAAADQFLFTMPGAASFGFARQQRVTYTSPGSLDINYRTVLAGDRGGASPAGIRANANGLVAPLAFGATWNAGGVGTFYNAAVGVVNDLGGKLPAAGYDHQYLAWMFADSTQSGAIRFGWVEISLAMNNYIPGGPLVTIWGYAYDNTGAKPTMGQQPVPEPTSGALMVMGAMALGARGLRKWRQKREAVAQS